MDRKHTLSALSMQFALGCGLCTVTFLMLLREEPLVLTFYPLALLLYAPLLYTIDCIYLRRQRTLAGLVILNAFLMLVMYAAIWLFDGWQGIAYMIFAALFCLWPTVNACVLAQKPPEIHGLILCLDAMVSILVLFSAFSAISGNTQFWVLFPSAAGCAAAFLALLTRRSGQKMRIRDWGLVLASFGGLMGALWVVMRYAATAGRGLVATWNGLIGLIKFIFTSLWNILVFLLTLVPNMDYGEYQPELEPVVIPEFVEQAERDPGSVFVIAVILALTLVVAGVILLLWLRKIKLGGKAPEKSGALESRDRLNLLQALCRLFIPLRRYIRTHLWLWKYRNTPEGLYCTLVNQFKRTPWHKRTNETVREFLLRLKVDTRENLRLCAAFEKLIPAVERALYAPGNAREPFPDAFFLRQSVKKTVTRHYVQSLTGRLKSAVAQLIGS